MLPRFFAPDAGVIASNADVALPQDESRHATSVLRLRTGDDLVVFDGRGHEWRARITSIARSTVTVRLDAPLVPAAEPRVRVVLLQAVLKGDHMDAAIRDATMLGAAEIRPLMTTHAAVSPRGASGAGAQARWYRVAVASAKQCRRAMVPVVSAAVPLAHALDDLVVIGADTRIVLAEPIVRVQAPIAAQATPRSAVLAVGPEGGWAQDELARLTAAGFVPLTLGSLTLRAEAAAMVALSVLRERWGDL